MADSYEKVFDSRSRRVRGLWRRNGVFYAQMRPTPGKHPVKIPLHGADTVPQALIEMQAKKKLKRDGEPVVFRRQVSPAFSACSAVYSEWLQHRSKKRPATVNRELSSIAALNAYFGSQEISKVPGLLAAYADERIKGGVSGRAADVDVIVARHIMKKANSEGIPVDYKFKWESLAKDPAKIRLVERSEIDAMRRAAENMAVIEIGGWQFSDYLELLACSGGREQETLRLRWSKNVNWELKKIGFGQDGLSKFGKERWMPFNPALEEHLKAMRLRSGGSDWLFPSRFSANNHVTTYRKNLMSVMKATGVTDFGFHHLRHYFASRAVMSGTHFKTLAAWLGHSDEGLLAAKIYSHLTADHSSQQAALVVL